MKYVIFVEGHTEEDNLPDFIGRWFDKQNLSQPIKLEVVRFSGWPDFNKSAVKKAKDYLESPDREKIIAVIGLLDLYGPTFYPGNITTVKQRYEFAVKHFENQVNNPKKFRMFMAVHELEAWLLSQPEIFDQQVYEVLKNEERQPEAI
ncbi:MAG: DUF4276 family protein, partial [Sedimentisphaerales bacterium]|nr:DUF4276 family protein [Sedimentisphaerales bacterium]